MRLNTMRYYEIYLPDEKPQIVTSIRKLKGLPEGTRIEAIVTERDGTLTDSWNVPVVDGTPHVEGRGKDAPRYHGLRLRIGRHEMDDNRLCISVEEAAARLDISRAFAYELARQGRLPTVRLGRRLLVPLKALERMLEEK